MDQLRLQFLQAALLSSALGQIPDEAREEPARSDSRFAHGQFHRKGGAVPALADDDPAGADNAPLARLSAVSTNGTDLRL